MTDTEYFAGYADGLETQLNQQRGVNPEVKRAEVLQTARELQAAARDHACNMKHLDAINAG